MHPSDFLLSGVFCCAAQATMECVTPRCSPQKTESSLQPVGSSWMTKRKGSPAICLSDSNMTMIISPQHNPILWRGIEKYVTYFSCFVLPPATYIVPSRHLSLFFSVIFRSWGDNVFQAEPESLLPTCFPYVIEKHTNGLAGESSMPVGLLGLEWPVDSDPLIPQRG